MRIEHLYYLKVTAECGSISLAAEKIYLSQQTLSDLIAKAEKTLAITIFNRSNKGVTLTEEGAIALEKAKVILSVYEDMLAISTPKEQVFTHLTVITHQSIIACFFAEIYAMFTLAFPKTQLKIREEMSPLASITQVATGEADMALIPISTQIVESNSQFQKYLNKLYYIKTLHVDLLYVVARKDALLAQRAWVTIDDLFRFPMVLNRNSFLAIGLKQWFPEKNLDVFMYSDSALAQIQAIKENNCIGFTEGYSLGQTFIMEDDLVLIPLKDSSVSLTAFLGPNIAHNPLVIRFLTQFQNFLWETLDHH